jgi:DNA-binding transcriptional MerR regulator
MQNSLQQLDLFGFPVETTVQPKKKEKAVTVINPPRMETVPAAANQETVEKVVPVKAAETVAAILPVKKISTGKMGSKRGRKSFKEMDTEADLVDVPDDEILKQKLYYSISEVAGWFKVNTSLLRYWENEFDILQPRKTRKGDRLFRVEDIKNLQLIYFLLRQRKFSIDGAKNYLKNNKEEANLQIQLVDSLNKFKSFLLELKANLNPSV